MAAGTVTEDADHNALAYGERSVLAVLVTVGVAVLLVCCLECTSAAAATRMSSSIAAKIRDG